MTSTVITEKAAATKAVVAQPGRLLIQLIDAGVGSSGIYPAATLESAARRRVFPKGLQMFLDHPSGREESERPERSVRDLVGTLSEDARYDSKTRALVAEAAVFDDYRSLLSQLAGDIGVSIRATASVSYGESGGQKGVVVDELVEALSVDYVTKAGRGGRVLAVLESDRSTAGPVSAAPALSRVDPWARSRRTEDLDAPQRDLLNKLAEQYQRIESCSLDAALVFTRRLSASLLAESVSAGGSHEDYLGRLQHQLDYHERREARPVRANPWASAATESAGTARPNPWGTSSAVKGA